MYPLLRQLPTAPASLCNELRTIALAAGWVASGNAAAVTDCFRHIAPSRQDAAYELALLQAVPFIGIPRVLHAAAALQVDGVVGNQSGSMRDKPAPQPPLSTLHARGTATFDVVYGRNAMRVRKRLEAFHPALEQWITTWAYGAVLSAPYAPDIAVTLRERELCAVAVLAADPCASAQLASHLRGALKAGAIRAEVRAVLDHTRVIHGSDAAASADAVWDTYERARYAL